MAGGTVGGSNANVGNVVADGAVADEADAANGRAADDAAKDGGKGTTHGAAPGAAESAAEDERRCGKRRRDELWEEPPPKMRDKRRNE